MIRQDLIQFIEKCNFAVSNKGDYDKNSEDKKIIIDIDSTDFQIYI